MKMLSTPTARTRKGMTSMMIKLSGTPMKEYTPMDVVTDMVTTITPERPNTILESICKEGREEDSRGRCKKTRWEWLLWLSVG